MLTGSVVPVLAGGVSQHVGWWEPTLVRGDDKEAIHIPNHKFSVSIIRNMSQRNHWRIKTYFGICHMDVAKVPVSETE